MLLTSTKRIFLCRRTQQKREKICYWEDKSSAIMRLRFLTWMLDLVFRDCIRCAHFKIIDILIYYSKVWLWTGHGSFPLSLRRLPPTVVIFGGRKFWSKGFNALFFSLFFFFSFFFGNLVQWTKNPVESFSIFPGDFHWGESNLSVNDTMSGYYDTLLRTLINLCRFWSCRSIFNLQRTACFEFGKGKLERLLQRKACGRYRRTDPKKREKESFSEVLYNLDDFLGIQHILRSFVCIYLRKLAS